MVEISAPLATARPPSVLIEVVDHHRRTLAREQLCVGLTEPAARAGDQRHLAIE
jgi:hypothetical protein